MADRWQLEIRSPAGKLLDIVRRPLSWKFTRVVNDVGDFEFVFPVSDARTLAVAVNGNHVQYRLNGVIRFGGIIYKRAIKTKDREATVTISGPSWIALLQRRLAKPTALSAYDSYVGVNADNIMKRIAVKNMGASASLDRQYSYLQIAAETSSHPTLANYNARYETVLEAFQQIINGVAQNYATTGAAYYAAIGNLFFDIVRIESTGMLELRTYSPLIGSDFSRGKPNAVLFEMIGGNISEVDYVEDAANVKNAVTGGGTGDGAARLIREGFDSQSIVDWGRFEYFVDATSADTSAKLDLEIFKKMADVSRGQQSITFSISGVGRFKYGVDFNFGDLVTATYPDAGIDLTAVVSGITVKQSGKSEPSMELSIGEPNIARLSPGKALATFFNKSRQALALTGRH